MLVIYMSILTLYEDISFMPSWALRPKTKAECSTHPCSPERESAQDP